MGRQSLMRRPPWWIAVAVVAADQVTKVWAVVAIDRPIELIGEFLRFRLTRNPGAAFSSFMGGGRWLAVVAIVIAVGVAIALPRVSRRFEQVALALILGGAAGNLLDRVFRGEGVLDGAVVDFIDFSFWPTFNLADSAISIGVVILAAAAFILGPPSDAPEVPEPETAIGNKEDDV
ncbi:MAG: signal peptidase II [Acidimicrobiia bacterium]